MEYAGQNFNNAQFAGAPSPGKELGIADLTDSTVNQLHQAVSMLDTLVERLVGPSPAANMASPNSPPTMGILSVAITGNALAGDVLNRLRRLSDLI